MQRYQTLPAIPGHIQANHWSVIVPEARTNLISNPSFELNTDNWAASGTGVTLTRDTAYSFFGGASGRMTDTAATGSSEFIVASGATVTAGDTYTLSFRYRKTATARGTGVAGVFIKNGGGTTVSQLSVSLCRGNSNGWLYAELSFVVPASGVTAEVYFATDGATTGAFNLWIDGVQLEEGGYATTYIDGDQDGCYWTGEAHKSTSGRYSYTRSGGRIVQLKDFKFIVLASVGFGAPALNTVSVDYALGGSQYQRSVIGARGATIAGAFQADGLVDLKRQKAALYAALKPDAVSPQQPVRLVYQQRDIRENTIGSPIYVDAVYTGGLEGNEANEHAEQAAIGFRLHLPWVGTGESDTGIASGNYSEFTAVAVQDKATGAWVDLSHPRASGGGAIITAGPVEDRSKRVIYAADTAVIRKYDGASWSTVGTAAGGSAFVYDILFAPDGNLYVAGSFTSVSGVSATNVAKWNGSAWSALGSGVASSVSSLAWSRDGQLLAAGSVIARWNGSAWSTVVDVSSGSKITGVGAPTLSDIAVAANGDVWACGNLSQLGGLDYRGLIRIDLEQQIAGTWGLTVTEETLWLNDIPTVLEPSPDGNLWLGGMFTSVGGNTSAKRLVQISPPIAVATGMGGQLDSGTITAIGVGSDGSVYVGINTSSASYLPIESRIFYGVSLLTRSANGLWKHGLVSNYSGYTGDVVGILDSTYGLVIGSDLYMKYPTRTTVQNQSSAQSPVTITVTGPGQLISIVQYTTGKILRFDGLDVVSGEILTIKTGPSATFTSDRRGDLSSYLTPESNLYTFTLQSGSNDIGAMYLTSTGSLSAYYRARYDTIDQR